MDYTKAFKDICSFIDSNDFNILKQKAKKNQGTRNDFRKNKSKTSKVNSVLAKKFKVSLTFVSYVLKIKKDGRFINDIINEKKTVSETIRYIKSGNKKRKKRQVYFIQDIGTGRIKIGITKNITERFNKISNYNAGKLILLLAIEGFKKKEIDLHKKFKQYKHHGEWFEPSKELLDYIEELKNYIS